MVIDMVKSTEKELAEKYANQTPEEMEKEQESLEREVAVASRAMEQEISSFSIKIDELISPVTNKLMCKVQRPTTSQWKQLVPPELAKYKKDPKSIPLKVAEKYETLVYDIMAELIVQPKHTAKWWKDNTTYDFVVLFQDHMIKTFDKMSENLGNF